MPCEKYLLGVVPVLQHCAWIEIVPNLVKVLHQLVVCLRRFKILAHLRQRGGLEHVDDKHGVMG